MKDVRLRRRFVIYEGFCTQRDFSYSQSWCHTLHDDIIPSLIENSVEPCRLPPIEHVHLQATHSPTVALYSLFGADPETHWPPWPWWYFWYLKNSSFWDRASSIHNKCWGHPTCNVVIPSSPSPALTTVAHSRRHLEQNWESKTDAKIDRWTRQQIHNGSRLDIYSEFPDRKYWSIHGNSHILCLFCVSSIASFMRVPSRISLKRRPWCILEFQVAVYLPVHSVKHTTRLTDCSECLHYCGSPKFYYIHMVFACGKLSNATARYCI